MWILPEAVALVTTLNEKLMPLGYAVGLTGGCLFKGSSEKDVDIIIYPRGDVDPIPHKLLTQVLQSHGFTLTRDMKTVQSGWAEYHQSNDKKHVEEWAIDGKRIDFFFLS